MSPSRSRLFPRRSGPRGFRSTLTLPSHPAGLAARLERSAALDRAVRVLSGAVQRAAPPGPRADALHGAWLGQPVHPALSDLPVGFWVSATTLDLVPGTERASRLLIALGLAGAIPSAAAGLADWSVLHQEQQRVGLAHAASGAGAWTLFAASLFARLTRRQAGGRMLALGGLATLAAGTYLGRHLAFALGAGASHAEPVAHLAPLGWHDLCPVRDLPDGRLVRRQLGYLNLAVVRRGSEVMAVADRCAHLGGPLHQGKVTGDEDGGPYVTCPWHGSTFRLTDGTVVHGPATARQPAFGTRVTDGGMVQVRPAPVDRARRGG